VSTLVEDRRVTSISINPTGPLLADAHECVKPTLLNGLFLNRLVPGIGTYAPAFPWCLLLWFFLLLLQLSQLTSFHILLGFREQRVLQGGHVHFSAGRAEVW